MVFWRVRLLRAQRLKSKGFDFLKMIRYIYKTKKGEEVEYVYSKVRIRPIKRTGKGYRGKFGLKTVPNKFIGRNVRIIFLKDKNK